MLPSFHQHIEPVAPLAPAYLYAPLSNVTSHGFLVAWRANPSPPTSLQHLEPRTRMAIPRAVAMQHSLDSSNRVAFLRG